jgi:hypothetical protein
MKYAFSGVAVELGVFDQSIAVVHTGYARWTQRRGLEKWKCSSLVNGDPWKQVMVTP